MNERLRTGEYIRLTAMEIDAVDRIGKALSKAKQAWDSVIKDILAHHDLPASTILRPVDPAKGIYYPVLEEVIMRDTAPVAADQSAPPRPRLVEDTPDGQ